MLIAYTLLRRWMREMAAHVQVEPQRISFHTASYAIVNLLAVPAWTLRLCQNSWQPYWRNRDTCAAPRRTGAASQRSSKTRFQILNEKMPVSSN